MSNAFLDGLSESEKEILKLVLSGGSVIDWPRLYFATQEDVFHFLKVNEFDFENPKDLERLLVIHSQAVDYLQRELKLNLHPSLKESPNMVKLLLIASKSGDPLQPQASALLKTMNIINHIDGRELLYNCPISLRDLFSLVEDKIERTLSSLNLGSGGPREIGPIRYKGGRKPKESLITKLLCKRETISAQIYDRVRYRIVTRSQDDILKVILHLFQNILPFNYVIPGASMNQLIQIDPKRPLDPAKTLEDSMEYSGADYKVCKFVVDIPIKMEKFLASSGSHFYRDSLGILVYVLVEFQLVDEETDAANNSGESSHGEYKKRQKSGVLKRLMSK